MLLLAFTPALACKIEHSGPNTITIYGRCSEAVVVAQLQVALKRMEHHAEGIKPPKTESQAEAARRIDLVNGHIKGGATTFFHRKK